MKNLQSNIKQEWNFILKSHKILIKKPFNQMERELWFLLQILLHEIDSSKSEYENAFRWSIYYLTKAHFLKTYF